LLKNKTDSKEIAHSLEISRDSAKIAKHRLKRKLGLKREENLDDFLQMFDEGGPSNQDQNGRQVDLYSMELP
jgi:hypothetical protein